MDTADIDRPSDTAIDLTGMRAEAVQRIQIGAFGLATMLLLVGLASIVMDRARQAEKSAVPEAAATVAAEPSLTPNGDPLADTGLVPDLPASEVPTAAPTATSAPLTGIPAEGENSLRP